jgi:hypothetical protein
LSQTTVNDTVAQIEPSSTRSAIELRLGATRRNRLGEDCKRASHGVRTPRTIAVRERVINGHVSVASDDNKYTYIHSTSDHKFLPNGTRRRPQIVVVDHVLVRHPDKRPPLCPTTLSSTREHQSQIKRPIARPISLRQPKRIATRSHSYRTQELQGREESREYNVDADDLRNDYTDTAPLAPTLCRSSRRC